MGIINITIICILDLPLKKIMPTVNDTHVTCVLIYDMFKKCFLLCGKYITWWAWHSKSCHISILTYSFITCSKKEKLISYIFCLKIISLMKPELGLGLGPEEGHHIASTISNCIDIRASSINTYSLFFVCNMPKSQIIQVLCFTSQQ